jgi:O-antigen/teichoic acid export membrane protein
MQLAVFHYQANLAFGKAGVVNMSRSAVLVIPAFAVICGQTRSGLETGVILTGVSAAAAAGACFPLLALQDLRPLRWKDGSFSFESAWLTVYYLASAGFATVDVFIVAALLHHHDVATFGAAQRYYAFALGVGPALLTVVRVRASQHDVIDSPSVQFAMLRSWARRAIIPSVVLTVFLGAAAPALIPIADGGRYPGSIPTFQLLLVGVCAYYVLMPAASLLMAQKRYRALALAVLGAFVANAIGDLCAVRIFGLGTAGIAGVASVTYLGYFLATVMLAIRGQTRAPEGTSRSGVQNVPRVVSRAR